MAQTWAKKGFKDYFHEKTPGLKNKVAKDLKGSARKPGRNEKLRKIIGNFRKITDSSRSFTENVF